MSDNPEVADDVVDEVAEDTAEGDSQTDAQGVETQEPEVAAETSLEAELAERTDDLQRITAEYANYRRRTERDREGIIDMAKADVIAQLLPIIDDLDLAAQHGDLDDAGPLKSVSDKIRAVLTTCNVTVVGEAGDAFDPEKHEAVQDLSNGEEKTVGTVLRRGYQMGDRLIRTAMVIIADPATEDPT